MEGDGGKTAYQAGIFANRLAKRHRVLRKWARRERVTCYRLYDRDIPEVPLAVDLYEFLPFGVDGKGEAAEFLKNEDARISANDASAAVEKSGRQWLHVQLYERPYEKDEAEEEAWLSAMADAAAAAVGVARERVVVKTRKRQRGSEQYGRTGAERTVGGIVSECGQLLRVNLSDYLDTGLFLDHRPLRSLVRSSCAGRRVLNLFCYTGSFSVYAAEGRASLVRSVDLSRTYLAWAESNMELNGFSGGRFEFVRADVGAHLRECARAGERFDMIILDPPTFSNSKATEGTLDVNRDWAGLCASSLGLLDAGGTLYFSTNSRKLSFDEAALAKAAGRPVSARDITASTIPEDYAGQRPHRCWEIRASE